MRNIISLTILMLFIFTKSIQAQNTRIIEIIDDKDKPNLTMANPKNPFYKLIYDAVTIGVKGTKITAYTDSNFKKTITAAEILKIGASVDTFPIFPDPENEPDLYYDTTVSIVFDPIKINRYVILYHQIEINGEISNVIYAIAPLIDNWIGAVRVNEQVMFWVKFDDLADVIGKEIFYAAENEGGLLTYKDFFEKHLFAGRAFNPAVNMIR